MRKGLSSGDYAGTDDFPGLDDDYDDVDDDEERESVARRMAKRLSNGDYTDDSLDDDSYGHDDEWSERLDVIPPARGRNEDGGTRRREGAGTKRKAENLDDCDDKDDDDEGGAGTDLFDSESAFQVACHLVEMQDRVEAQETLRRRERERKKRITQWIQSAHALAPAAAAATAIAAAASLRDVDAVDDEEAASISQSGISRLSSAPLRRSYPSDDEDGVDPATQRMLDTLLKASCDMEGLCAFVKDSEKRREASRQREHRASLAIERLRDRRIQIQDQRITRLEDDTERVKEAVLAVNSTLVDWMKAQDEFRGQMRLVMQTVQERAASSAAAVVMQPSSPTLQN
ncbi:uncharacterized protein PSFLO_06968 [Pseudozyma flocculosa]|nr:uncharacterized protein PSFLO_06968 [Pseudozyma flocculosa]